MITRLLPASQWQISLNICFGRQEWNKPVKIMFEGRKPCDFFVSGGSCPHSQNIKWHRENRLMLTWPNYLKHKSFGQTIVYGKMHCKSTQLNQTWTTRPICFRRHFRVPWYWEITMKYIWISFHSILVFPEGPTACSLTMRPRAPMSECAQGHVLVNSYIATNAWPKMAACVRQHLEPHLFKKCLV